MRSVFSFLIGILAGAFIGGLLAILFAPASGEELRAQMQERAQYIQSEVRRAASERRAELERQLAELRAPRTPSSE